MAGLAEDKGLYVPDSIPTVAPEELEAWRSLSYSDLAVQVIRKFVDEDEVPLEKLTDIVTRSCAAFRSPEVTPIVNVGGHPILVRLTLVRAFLTLMIRASKAGWLR
jgi:threonine synthase